MTPPAVADGLQLALWATLTALPGDEHPQHVFAALAAMVQRREPLFGTGKQLCRVRA